MIEILQVSLFLLVTVGWILVLINAARSAQWAWFVLTLLVPVVAVAYVLIAWRSEPDARSGQAAERRLRRRRNAGAARADRG